MDPDPGGPKHMDPTDPDSDPDPQQWFLGLCLLQEVLPVPC